MKNESVTHRLARVAALSGFYLESDAARAYFDLPDQRGIDFEDFEDFFIGWFD